MRSLKERKRMMHSECKRTGCPTLIKTRLCRACHSGDIHAINVQINLQYKYVDGGKGKWLVNNRAHQKQQFKENYLYNHLLYPIFSGSGICSLVFPANGSFFGAK